MATFQDDSQFDPLHKLLEIGHSTKKTKWTT
jgi:hypothetical protein